MLSPHKEINQNLLSKFFLTLLDTERTLEACRKTLSDHTHFDGYSLFKCISKSGAGFIKPQDLVDFMNLIDLSPTPRQAYALFHSLHLPHDLILNYIDFLNLVLPKNPPLPKLLSYPNSVNRNQDKTLQIDCILKDFSTLLLQYINSYFSLELIRNEFDVKIRSNLTYYFGLVDKDGKGFWDDNDIYEFLRGEDGGIGFDDVKVIIGVFGKWSERVSRREFGAYFKGSQDRG
jgi:hypothetical protein